MDRKLRVIDLTCGIGGRSKAFIEAGFEVVCAIDNDRECANVYNNMIENINFIFSDLKDISPKELPNADIITGKISSQSFNIAGNKYIERNDINNNIYNIIHKRLPKMFLLEAPPLILTKNKGDELRRILESYEEIGYKIVYHVFKESDYSGYPVIGKQLYIVGIRKDIEFEEFYFPDPKYSDYNYDLYKELDTNVDEWYRRIHKNEDIRYEVGKYYLRDRGNFSQTNIIHMGLYREMFLVDSLGLRRFTHNELAVLKGLNNYDFNSCSNKQRMYMKISYASNFFIVQSIAESINKYFESKESPDNEYATKEILKKIKPKKEKSSKVNTKDILFPKHRIVNIHIDNLKGIKNLDVPINKSLTAIMGVNGSGKSTILHALACVYSPYKNGDNYKFSFFFTPNPDSTWKDSKLSITYFDENAQKEVTREYKKDIDRWSPRYENRPKRDVHFIGIESCIPEIEIEKQTSFIDYSTNAASDELSHKIIKTAANILNKNYESLTYHKTKKKELVGVRTKDNITYSSLSMGAGEQRVIKILKLAYSVNQYSLILIDEIDLLLHVTALKRLIVTLSDIATKRNLQIFFTTHSLEMNKLKDSVDIRYLENLDQKTMVYNSINIDMIYELSDYVAKPLEIYVEDLLAEIIVKRVAADLNILSSIKVTKYGAANNAFVVASSLVLKGEKYNNILIILDGDIYVTKDEKEKAIKKILSGTEREHDDRILDAVSFIKEFALPDGISPEEFIYGMLLEMDENSEIVRIAKKLKAVSNTHQWLDRLVERMGHSEEMVLNDIISIVVCQHFFVQLLFGHFSQTIFYRRHIIKCSMNSFIIVPLYIISQFFF